ncbi:MAG: SGNH/GDSL hydrolase family protein [Planctomycetota bacterium]|jgi:lysophospholipase L1-like esterase
MTTSISQAKSVDKRKTSWRFLKCFLIVLAIFVGGTGGFLYFNLYFLFPGSGPAGPSVPSEPFKQTWSQRNILLLGIGDSITDGFGASRGFSYFDRLIQNPPGDSEDMLGKNLSAVFPNMKTENLAVSGSNSIYHSGIVRRLETHPAGTLGIVVMTTGGNDLIHDYGRAAPKEGAMYGATFEQAQPWISNFERRLNEIINALTAKFPGGCHVFLANIYDPSDGTGRTAKWITGLPKWPDGLAILKAYNKIIAKAAQEHENVHLVDIHDAFLGHGIHCKKFWLKHCRLRNAHFWYGMIIEDPNDRGYDAIRRLFLKEMAKVFLDPASLRLSGND